MTGTHQISYTNNFAPAGSAYHVNAFVDRGVPITLGKAMERLPKLPES